MRTLGFAALAALLLGLVGSHDLLHARPDGVGNPHDACDDGQRFSRRDGECVDRGSRKQLVCHFEMNEETGEVAEVGELLNVSEESAHLRLEKHPHDCPPLDDGEVGDECECPAG